MMHCIDNIALRRLLFGFHYASPFGGYVFMNKNASVLTCDMRGMYYLLLVGAVLRSLVYRVARQAGAVAIPLIVDRSRLSFHNRPRSWSVSIKKQ